MGNIVFLACSALAPSKGTTLDIMFTFTCYFCYVALQSLKTITCQSVTLR